MDILKEEMRRAYVEQMKATIGIDVEPSFVDEFLGWDGAAGRERLNRWEVLESFELEPGHEGYSRRTQEFFDSRDAKWNERFGWKAIFGKESLDLES